MSDVTIKVAVRVRPLIGQELLQSSNQCVKCLKGKPQLIIGKNRCFSFDYVFHPSDHQVSIYNQCVNPLVDGFFQGYNSAIIAYGQTGAGKTFTMGTSDGDLTVHDMVGILPRAIQKIFKHLSQSNCEWHMKVSFIEIYLEDVRDLLWHNDHGRRELFIREDDKGNTVVAGLTEQIVTSYDEVMTLLDVGTAVRQTAQTKMNEDSSRSHCIFTIHLDQYAVTSKGDIDASSSVTSAKFNFVDLAGSERLHRSFNRGERFRESVSINSGLLSLGNVISNLSDPKRRNIHVPYRDSKLTRLLKDSLGGNSRTLLVCCISPSTSNMDESLTTLKFAQRAGKVKNQPIVNIATNETQLHHMKEELKTLKDKLQQYNHVSSNPENSTSSIVKELVNRITEVQQILSVILIQDCIDTATIGKLKEWKTEIDKMGDVIDVLTIFNNALQQHKKFKGHAKTEIKINSIEQEVPHSSKSLRHLKDKNIKKEHRVMESKSSVMGDDNESDVDIDVPDDVAKDLDQFQSSSVKAKPHSAPGHRATLLTDIDRKILQSSPGALGYDPVIARVRAESQLLALELMSLDTVGYDDDRFSSDDNEIITKQDQNQNSDEAEKDVIKDQHRKVLSARERRRINNRKTSKLPVRNKNVSLQHQLFKNKEACQENLRKSQQLGQSHKSQLEKLTANIRKHEEVSYKRMMEIEQLESAKQASMDSVKLLEGEIKRSKHELEEAQQKLKIYKEQNEKNDKEKQRLEIEYHKKIDVMNRKIIELEKETLKIENISLLYKDSKSKVEELENGLELAKIEEKQLKEQLNEEGERKRVLEEKLEELEQQIKLKDGCDSTTELLAVPWQHSSPSSDGVDAKIQLIEFEIDRISSKQLEVKRHQKEIVRHLETLNKRELLIETSKSMQLEKLRCSQVLEKDLLKVSIQLDKINEQLRNMSANDELSSNSDIKQLQSKRDDLYKRATVLDNRLKDDNVIERVDQSALYEIQEAIEAIDIAIAYNKETLNHSKETTSDNQIEKDINSVFVTIDQLNTDEIHHVSKCLVERMIDLKTELEEANLTIDELHIDIADRDKAGIEMERYSKRLKLLADKQMEESKRNQQQEVQLLHSQMDELRNNQYNESNKLQKKIKQLEKDLYYYKRTSRDLKHKIRELIPSESISKSSVSVGTKEETNLGDDDKEFYLPRVDESPTKVKGSTGRGSKKALVSRQNLLDCIAAEEHKKLKRIFEDHEDHPRTQADSHAKESVNSRNARSTSQCSNASSAIGRKDDKDMSMIQDSIDAPK